MPERIGRTDPPSGARRLFFRFPFWLYRLGLGWLLGQRFLLLSHVGRKSGRTREAVLEVAHHDETVAQERYVPTAYVAIAHLAVGDIDGVFRCLSEPDLQAVDWAVFPWSDPVRSDPRFQALLDELGDR